MGPGGHGSRGIVPPYWTVCTTPVSEQYKPHGPGSAASIRGLSSLGVSGSWVGGLFSLFFLLVGRVGWGGDEGQRQGVEACAAVELPERLLGPGIQGPGWGQGAE